MKTANLIYTIKDRIFTVVADLQKQAFLTVKWTFFFLNPVIWNIKKALSFFLHVELAVL